MSVDSRIRESFLAAAGIQSAIGTRLQKQVKIQASAFPCVRYFRVSTVPNYTHDGRGNLGWSRYQFDVLSKNPDDPSAIADLFVAALATFNLTEDVTSPATVYEVTPNKLINRWDDLYSETEPIIYRTGLDFEIWHRE